MSIQNPQDISKGLLNEYLNENYYQNIIKIYGITKGPESELVMQYARRCDLHNHLQKHFTKITWNKQKLSISYSSRSIVEIYYLMILIQENYLKGRWVDLGHTVSRFGLINGKIGDLGISQPVNGVIPYIAPEIFKICISDIYSMERPGITEDTPLTPECFANLMKLCWDSDPSERPSMERIHISFKVWSTISKVKEQFERAELKRIHQ
ncbi:hypothetical protein C1645_833045 [Glomus cerebriforme]|uniref:Protein kinase domain-containing protein n=1 Tax=Glomus cerebriforme TaxID=658196 RepID=A0A397SCA9_9GLOM|nr:hypothetical protein C1645_833045 [Glomus cerebriforme]